MTFEPGTFKVLLKVFVRLEASNHRVDFPADEWQHLHNFTIARTNSWLSRSHLLKKEDSPRMLIFVSQEDIDLRRGRRIVIDNSKYMLETLLVRKGTTITQEEDEPLSPPHLAIIEAPDGVYQLRGCACPFHCTTKGLSGVY
jgi:hypothetical protein